MEKQILVPDRIFTLPKLLSEAECFEYIALSKEIGYSAAPLTTAHSFEFDTEVRNNLRVILDDPVRAEQLWQRIVDFVPTPLNGRTAIGLNERFRFYRYDPGQRFAPHYDGIFRRENGEASRLTFMIYLNEGFDGGETRFYLSPPLGAISVVPQTGMALCFVHDLLHEGASVLQGRKYVLRSDIMYSPEPE